MISVIMPAYNAEKYLDRAISSVVNQSYPNLELIVIDDHSIDETSKIMDQWKARDKRIRTIHICEDAIHGPSAARNRGIIAAQGEYIAFVDSDDWIEPDMMQKLFKAFELYDDIDVVMCNGLIENQNGSTRDLYSCAWSDKVYRNDDLLCLLLEQRRWTLWGKLYRYEMFEDNLADERIKYGEDIELNWRLYISMRGGLVCNFIGYHYVMNVDSLCHLSKPLTIVSVLNILSSINDLIEPQREKLKKTIELVFLSFILSSLIRLICEYGDEKIKLISKYQNALRKERPIIEQYMELTATQREWIDCFCQGYHACKRICYKKQDGLINGLLNFMSVCKQVYIYGDGRYSMEVANLLKSKSCDFCGFIVSSCGKREYKLCGKPVKALASLTGEVLNIGMVLTMTKEHNAEVIEILHTKGYTHIFDANQFGVHL